MQLWQSNSIDQQLIELALQEDLGLPYYDATTAALFPSHGKKMQAKIISKHSTPVIISGLNLLPLIAQKYGADLQIETAYKDGDILLTGAVLAILHAEATTLLILERTILNFLRHLCAVATITHEFTRRIQHTHCKILDTRKTTPGWRHLEKYAVQCGGGMNHRQGLYDAIMIKDTHVDLLGGIEIALDKLPAPKTLPVIVEVRDLTELKIVLAHYEKVDRILLDNMRGDLLKEGVKLCQGKLSTEASGNLNLDNIVEVAESGIDFASIGMLTHSAGQVDLSMQIK